MKSACILTKLNKLLVNQSGSFAIAQSHHILMPPYTSPTMHQYNQKKSLMIRLFFMGFIAEILAVTKNSYWHY